MIFITILLLIPLTLLNMQNNTKTKKSAVKHLIKTDLPRTNNNNNTSVRLMNGSTRLVTPQEIESSAVLLQKKIFREKITPELIAKWGYDPALHKQLRKAPLRLRNISTTMFKLFKEFLFLSATQFKQEFDLLNSIKQNRLLFVASKKGLCIPLLLAHIYEAKLPPEIIQKYLIPHFSTKKIISHLRHGIISHNARNNFFTQTDEQVNDGRKLILDINHLSNKYTLVPRQLIKKNIYYFDGMMGNIDIDLENQTWYRITECKVLHDNESIFYCITFVLSKKELIKLQTKPDQTLKEICPFNKIILWTTDQHQNILDKKILDYGGHFFHIQFSPNKRFLVTSSYKTPDYPDNFVVITTLETKKDGSDFYDIYLPDINQETTSLCIDHTSTLLAIGSKYVPNIHENNISIRSMDTGQELLSLSGPKEHIINGLRFNHKKTRLVSVAISNNRCNTTICLWDITDISNTKQLSEFTLFNINAYKPHFSSNDKIIVASLTDGNSIFIDGITGSIISYEPSNGTQKMLHITSTFNHNNKLFASVLPSFINPSQQTANPTLWDARTGTVLAILPQKSPANGIGFAPSKRHIITTGHEFSTDDNEHKYYITTTALFDKNTHKTLKWLKNNPSLTQRCALRTAFAMQQTETLTPDYKDLLLSLLANEKQPSAEEIGAKAIIEQYL